MANDMSKEFALLEASRKLGEYLAQEHLQLDKMAENERVSQPYFQQKVERYNELVDVLNELFAAVSGTTSALYAKYRLVASDASVNRTAHKPLLQSLTGGEIGSPIPSGIALMEDPQMEDDGAGGIVIPQSTSHMPRWFNEGYPSYEAWFADKELERAELQDDLSVVVNVSLSQYRAAKALAEYQQTSEHDIATFSPEQEEAVDFLVETQVARMSRPTGDLRYLNHIGDVRVDRNPTQITDVQTAVERDGDQARKGMDIDVSRYVYRSPSMVVDDLLGDDIAKLRVHP